MVAIDLTQPTTARALVFGYASDTEVLAIMRANMPPGGIAEARMRDQPRMRPAAYRMVNSRILETALGFLNKDISALFLDGLTKCRAVVQAAQDTLADPDQAETVVTLIDPYRITSTHEPAIALEVDGYELAKVTFELSFVFGMLQTSVVIRRGAIEAVETEPCSLSATLTLKGWQPPLLQRDLPLHMRFPVRPPILVPVPSQAEPSTDAAPDGSLTVRFVPIRPPTSADAVLPPPRSASSPSTTPE
ncbi:MAG: hypothetical protein M3422_01735 [Actinomycetota bacterium]|nr:hypothetical protein [Actinomycetota bacterium]